VDSTAQAQVPDRFLGHSVGFGLGTPRAEVVTNEDRLP